jgi:hypothetical protein
MTQSVKNPTSNFRVERFCAFSARGRFIQPGPTMDIVLSFGAQFSLGGNVDDILDYEVAFGA